MKNLIRIIFLIILLPFFLSGTGEAKWLFTKDTGKWINLKTMPKETPQLQFDYAKSFEDKEEYRKAIQEYNKFNYNYSETALASLASYRTGICYENIGLYYKAFKEYKRIIEEDISFEGLKDVIKKEYQLGNLFFSGKRKKIMGTIPSITPSSDTAKEIFEHILKNAQYSEYAVKALYRIGEIYKQKKKYKEAIDEFKKVIADYKQPEYTEGAYFEVASCKYFLSRGSSYAQETTVEAIKEFESFINNYSQSTRVNEAKDKLRELKERDAESLYNTGEFYEKQQQLSAAQIYYQELVDKYPDLNLAQEARLRIEQINKAEGVSKAFEQQNEPKKKISFVPSPLKKLFSKKNKEEKQVDVEVDKKPTTVVEKTSVLSHLENPEEDEDSSKPKRSFKQKFKKLFSRKKKKEKPEDIAAEKKSTVGKTSVLEHLENSEDEPDDGRPKRSFRENLNKLLSSSPNDDGKPDAQAEIDQLDELEVERKKVEAAKKNPKKRRSFIPAPIKRLFSKKKEEKEE